VTGWIVSALLVLGSLFMLAAALGVYRMPDLYMRMSSSTKASTFGAALLLLGVAFAFLDTGTTTKLIAIVLFLLITTPVAAHMIARAAYHAGVELWKGTHVDELAARTGARRIPPGSDTAD
jgi:multicomponent Na+:H+ antiporter subunit G